jgi:hypothetical protein
MPQQFIPHEQRIRYDGQVGMAGEFPRLTSCIRDYHGATIKELVNIARIRAVLK